ncbi:MAG: PD-(D/E)XK nuclease family protein [Candidatus Brocadiia bacterium]
MQTQLEFTPADPRSFLHSNVLIRALSEAIQNDPVREKWLLVPNLRVGGQWLDRVAAAGTGVLNTHEKTMRGMVMDLAGERLAEDDRELAGTMIEEILLDSVWGELGDDAEDGYLSGLDRSMELVGAVRRSLLDLRLAGQEPEMMDERALEVPAKGRELRRLAELYLRELADRGYVDYPGAIHTALRVIGQEGLPPEVLVLVPAPDLYDYAPLELRLLESIPDEQLVELDMDRPGRLPEGEDINDVTFLRWVGSGERPEMASPGDGTVEFLRAVGEVNEVREMLRRCLDSDVRMDEVEILYTDADTYVPLIYEELGAILPEGVRFDDRPTGATFAEGVPVSYSRPGRGLRAWLEWWDDDFAQTGLVRMLRDGLLEVEERSRAELADFLRSIPIHEGRENYLPELDARMTELENRLQENRRGGERDEGADAQRELRRRLEGCRMLRECVADLLEATPDRDGSEVDLLRAARRILQEVIHSAGKLDEFAVDYLTERISELEELLEDEGGSTMNVREWLLQLTADSSVAGMGPRPGCLYVAPLHSGGHTGRPRTFVLGLDDARFPASARQDPILLDVERSRISDQIPTSAGRVERSWRNLARTLAGLRGRVTLGYSCCDILEGRDRFPGPALISAYRLLSGDHTGDQSDFMEWDRLPEPVAFAGGQDSGGRAVIDESDWWLGRLCGLSAAADHTRDVAGCFPMLRRGFAAEEQRESVHFTRFDGNVPRPDAEVAGIDVLSSSRLQKLGGCPLAYFFGQILGLEVPEELTREPDQWLDALEQGTLLHEVYRRFMAELLDRGDRPDVNRHWDELQEILAERVEVWARRKPPPREDLREAQHREMLDCCRIFLAQEDRFCRNHTPVYLESSVGMPGDGGDYSLGVTDPVELRLPNGRRMRARGRLDRIDLRDDAGGEVYEVWDYKTGSTSRYTKSTFRAGRLVQHVVYMKLAQKCLAERVSPEARVRLFGYFFTSENGGGDRVRFTPQDLEGGMEIVQRLIRIAEEGAFCATTTTDDCRYCDFQMICRDIEQVTERSTKKVENEENSQLEPFRLLRC